MTNKVRYAFLNRIHVRGWLLAAALGCVWLNAHAVNKNNIGRLGQTSNGRSTTLGPVTNSGGSTIPIASPLEGGWTKAGNYGVAPSAVGPMMNMNNLNGQVYISGTKYPFQAGFSGTWAGYVVPVLGGAAAIGCTLATGGVATAACLALPVALPYLYEWITKAGGRVNPQTGQLERYNDGQGIWDTANPATSCRGSDPLAVGLCGLNKLIGSGWPANTVFTDCYYHSQSPTQMGVRCKPVPSNGSSDPLIQVIRYGTTDPSWLPSSMDDIAPYMRNVNPDPRVWGEALERGAELPLPNPTITGPSQIQGPEKSTTNPDGSRTVERTTYNFQTAGNTINNTSNVTTTTTYNTDNSVRNSSTSTTTPTAEDADKESECEKRPNSLGCQELDEPPAGEIPRETKTITYAEESVFGGGSCPSDKQWSSGTTGHSYKLVDWTTLCGFALPARALVILLAVFAAFLIVMPGKEVRT